LIWKEGYAKLSRFYCIKTRVIHTHTLDVQIEVMMMMGCVGANILFDPRSSLRQAFTSNITVK
jgi:hypothetical protein